MLDLLETFGGGTGALTLTEVARRADLSLPTAHRLLHEVIEWGGVEPDGPTRYRLSAKLLNLAAHSTRMLRLREQALPHLTLLHRRSGGRTVHLVVRDGFSAMFVDAIRSRSGAGIPDETRIGGLLPLHATAAGMTLLANADDSFVDAYLSRPLRRYTSHTVVDPEQIRRSIGVIRRRRYSISEQSLLLGGFAVAALIPYDGGVDAAVGIVVPSDVAHPAELVAPVLATARDIATTIAEDDDDVAGERP